MTRGEFERVYGIDGEWASTSPARPGYIGTELLRDVEVPRRYLVIDRWESTEAYNAFVAANREEYMRRVDETPLPLRAGAAFGTFENVWPATG